MAVQTLGEIMEQSQNRRYQRDRSASSSDGLSQYEASALLAEINRRIGELQQAKPPETIDEKRQDCQVECDSYNQQDGDLPGDNCEKCRNKGRILRPVFEKLYNDFAATSFVCDCMPARVAKQRLMASGIGPMLMKCTLDNFDTSRDRWQDGMKLKAAQFVTVAQEGRWFYIGGDAGSGKSHLCAGIMQELLTLGMACTWMDWIDDSTRAINGWRSDYDTALEPWRKARVLVIDDFLKPIKTAKNSGNMPTPESLKLAYGIINYRYNNPRLITVISSEHALSTLMGFDQAMASRIEHRCGAEFILDNGTIDGDRNVRHLYTFHAAEKPTPAAPPEEFVDESLFGM